MPRRRDPHGPGRGGRRSGAGRPTKTDRGRIYYLYCLAYDEAILDQFGARIAKHYGSAFAEARTRIEKAQRSPSERSLIAKINRVYTNHGLEAAEDAFDRLSRPGLSEDALGDVISSWEMLAGRAENEAGKKLCVRDLEVNLAPEDARSAAIKRVGAQLREEGHSISNRYVRDLVREYKTTSSIDGLVALMDKIINN